MASAVHRAGWHSQALCRTRCSWSAPNKPSARHPVPLTAARQGSLLGARPRSESSSREDKALLCVPDDEGSEHFQGRHISPHSYTCCAAAAQLEKADSKDRAGCQTSSAFKQLAHCSQLPPPEPATCRKWGQDYGALRGAWGIVSTWGSLSWIHTQPSAPTDTMPHMCPQYPAH